MRRLDPDIFKAYDIRGIYGEQIDGEVAERIARAFAHVLARLAGKQVSELRVGLGRDMRLSAPELAARYRELFTALRGRDALWGAFLRKDGEIVHYWPPQPGLPSKF